LPVRAYLGWTSNAAISHPITKRSVIAVSVVVGPRHAVAESGGLFAVTAAHARRPGASLLRVGPGLGNGTAYRHGARRTDSPVVKIAGGHAIGCLRELGSR
jgi:hypothetical protein